MLRGSSPYGASVYDVLPTLFGVLEQPVARDWERRALTGVMSDASPRFVDTYQSADFSVPQVDVPSELSEEVLAYCRTIT